MRAQLLCATITISGALLGARAMEGHAAHFGLLVDRTSDAQWCASGAIAELSCALALHDVESSTAGYGRWALHAHVVDTGGAEEEASEHIRELVVEEERRRVVASLPRDVSLSPELAHITNSTLLGFVGPTTEDLELAAAFASQGFAMVGASATTASLRPLSLKHWSHVGFPASEYVDVALAVVRAMRWQRLAIVADIDAPSQAKAELFVTQERRQGRIHERYDAGLGASASAVALGAIHHSHTRVIILFAGPDAANEWMAAASHHGMTGRGWTYVIVGSWCGADAFSHAAEAAPSEGHGGSHRRRRRLEGEAHHTVPMPMGTVCIGPWRDPAIEHITALEALADDAGAGAVHSAARAFANATLVRAAARCSDFGSDGHEHGGEAHGYKFASPVPPPVASLVHDACLAMALGIQGAAQANVSAIVDGVRGVNVEGYTGMLKFDTVRGGRAQPHPAPRVYNFQNGAWKDIGSIETSDTPTKIQAALRTGGLVWPDGQPTAPTDRVPLHDFAPALYSMLVVTFLGLSIALGHWMHHSRLNEKCRLTRIPQAAVVVAGGIAVGVVIRVVIEIIIATSDLEEGPSAQVESLKEAIAFDEHIFFLLMLPIIIYESSYNMKNKRVFFKNTALIAAYAVAGTVMNTLITGGALAILADIGWLGIASNMRWTELFAFAAAISAVDPVATLGVLSAMGVPQRLFVLVMGESIINDAVAVALFRAFCGVMVEPADGPAFINAGLAVAWLLVGSTLIGVIVALLTALLYKALKLEDRHVEAALMLLLSYSAFTAAEMFALSGIISSLIAGLVNNYFTQKNMTEDGKDLATHMVGLLAHVSESIIFFMVGVNIVVGWQLSASSAPIVLILFTLILITFSRLFSVFFITGIGNGVYAIVHYVKTKRGGTVTNEASSDDSPSDVPAAGVAEPEGDGDDVEARGAAADADSAALAPSGAFRKDEYGEKQVTACGDEDGVFWKILGKTFTLPLNWQILMWHAGLRGAIAFVLVSQFPSQNVDLILQTTCVVILWTIFLQGGTTFDLIHLMRIETTNGDEDDDEHTAHEEFGAHTRTLKDRWENDGIGGKVGALMLWAFTIIPWGGGEEVVVKVKLHGKVVERRGTVMMPRRDTHGAAHAAHAEHRASQHPMAGIFAARAAALSIVEDDDGDEASSDGGGAGDFGGRPKSVRPTSQAPTLPPAFFGLGGTALSSGESPSKVESPAGSTDMEFSPPSSPPLNATDAVDACVTSRHVSHESFNPAFGLASAEGDSELSGRRSHDSSAGSSSPRERSADMRDDSSSWL